jgi:hypothetical protein
MSSWCLAVAVAVTRLQLVEDSRRDACHDILGSDNDAIALLVIDITAS